MDVEKLRNNIHSFLIKEKDEHQSAMTHLHSLLFSVIEEMNEAELDIVYEAEGEGFYAILECCTLRCSAFCTPIPQKYRRFFDKFADRQQWH